MYFQWYTEYSKQSTFSAALQVPWNYTEPALHFDGGTHKGQEVPQLVYILLMCKLGILKSQMANWCLPSSMQSIFIAKPKYVESELFQNTRNNVGHFQ